MLQKLRAWVPSASNLRSESQFRTRSRAKNPVTNNLSLQVQRIIKDPICNMCSYFGVG